MILGTLCKLGSMLYTQYINFVNKNGLLSKESKVLEIIKCPLSLLSLVNLLIVGRIGAHIIKGTYLNIVDNLVNAVVAFRIRGVFANYINKTARFQ